MEQKCKNFITLFEIQYEKYKKEDFNFSSCIQLIELLNKIILYTQKSNEKFEYYQNLKNEFVSNIKKNGYMYND